MSYRHTLPWPCPRAIGSLKFEGRKLLENNEDCKYEDSIFENIDVTIEFTNPADHNTMWIILRWERILWITLFADFADVTYVQDYVDHNRGPHEFIRIGEDPEDIEEHSLREDFTAFRCEQCLIRLNNFC